jgi:hypothetical protein
MAEKEKEVKSIKPIDPADVEEQITAIVAFLGAIDSSREEINRRVKHLKDTYGLQSTAVRAAANVLYKQNMEQLDEKEQQIRSILEIINA